MTVNRRSASMVGLLLLAGLCGVPHAETVEPDQELTETLEPKSASQQAPSRHPVSHPPYRWPPPPRPVYGWPPAPYGMQPLPMRAPAAPAPPAPELVETLAASAELSTLVRALEVAELDELLRGDGPFTVLAPTNAAFDALPDGLVEQLLADGERLRRVLEHHILEGRLTAADLLVAGEVSPLTGHQIEIGDLSVHRADIKARNGAVHVINELLVPPMF